MDMTDASFQVIAELLYSATGQEITDSRRWRVATALSGLFRELGIANADQLICLLSTGQDPALPGRIVEALLNNETYFFRDRAYFDNLSQFVLPELAERRAEQRRLRIWSAGCSTGQEPLSLAMLLARQRERWRHWRIEIVATDVSSRAIAAAAAACYNQFEIQRGISVTEMLSYFNESRNQWQARDDLRQMIRFEQHNLLGDPPAGAPFDLVLCRNVLLYFDGPTRELALARLHAAMAPDGWLVLGAGEAASREPGRFTAAGCGLSVYSRAHAPRGTSLMTAA